MSDDDIFEELKPKGFIGEYADFLLSNVPTSKEWTEDLATSVLSTVLGSERFVSTRIGRLRLNVWHIFVGPSGLSYKTLPLKDYVSKTLIKVGELTGEDVILPSSFSMEGMVEYMSQRHSQGIIIRDEVSTLFKETKGKSYAVDLIEFMSQMYDGTVLKRFTRKAKLEEVLRCYVVFLGATTPYLYDVIEPTVFVQGLGNRILFDLWGGSVKTFNGDELFYDVSSDSDRESRIEGFAEGLADLSAMEGYFLSPEPDKASKRLAEFKANKDLKANTLYKEDPSDLRSSYLVRAGEMAIKLSGLHAVSRSWRGLPKSKIPEIPIMPEDVDWAIAKVERHIESFEEFLTAWMTKPLMAKPISYKLDKEAFVNAVRKSPDGIITQEELLSALGWYKCNKYYQMRETVLGEGKVRRLTEEEIEALPDDVKKRHSLKGWRGKPPVVFIVNVKS